MSQRRMTLASVDANRPPAAGPSKARQSIAPSAGLRAVRQSLAREPRGRASLARQSLALPGRRSVGMGRMSLVPGGLPIAPPRDPRLRSKNARAQMEANVTAFIEATGFHMPGWTMRLVHEPTQSAFVAMFRHIYAHCIDPNYVIGGDGRKFEDEVMTLIKEVRYPFIDDLTKTKLTAAGSQQNWPACLAMLDWIVQLGTAADKIGAGPLARDGESELHALFFPFLWKCYARFWDNQDTYPDEMAALQAAFIEKNAQLTTSVAELTATRDALEAELGAFAGESPLARERHENAIIRSDIAKFSKYRDEILLPKLEKSRRSIARLHAVLADTVGEVAARQAERDQRQQLVDAQHISAAEFDRLYAARERLARELEGLAQSNRDALERCWQLELRLAKQQEEAERRLKQFNPAAERVELLPLAAGGATVHALSVTPSNPDTMLPAGVDMAQVRAEIDRLRGAHLAHYRALSDERAALQERLDEVHESLSRAQRDVRAAEARLDALREQNDDVNRVTGDEAEVTTTEIMRQESLIDNMEHASRMALQQAEARLAALRVQCQEGAESTEAERAAMHEEMCMALHTLLDLKVRVAEGLDAVAASMAD